MILVPRADTSNSVHADCGTWCVWIKHSFLFIAIQAVFCNMFIMHAYFAVMMTMWFLSQLYATCHLHPLFLLLYLSQSHCTFTCLSRASCPCCTKKNKRTLTDLPDIFLLVCGKTRSKTNVRFNELRHVCCVVPGGLLLCTEIACVAPYFPCGCQWLPMSSKDRLKNHFHMTWRWKKLSPSQQPFLITLFCCFLCYQVFSAWAQFAMTFLLSSIPPVNTALFVMALFPLFHSPELTDYPKHWFFFFFFVQQQLTTDSMYYYVALFKAILKPLVFISGAAKK